MTGLFRDVDPRTLHFGPLGLGGPMPPERAEELLEAETARMVLGDRVPASVRKQFSSLLAAYREGLHRYQAFTETDRDSHRVLEVALKVRFLEHYSGRLPLVSGPRVREAQARDFESARRLLNARDGWRLSGHPGFNGSLRSLLTWARAEGYFFGQLNRVREEVTVRIRNDLMHSEFDYLLTPPDALRSLFILYQWIQRLWGYDTPGGDAYPGLAPRFLWIVGRGPGTCTWMPIEYPLSEVESPREHETWHIVLAVARPELGDWRPDFECTAMPVDVMWGPGPWDKLCDQIRHPRASWKPDAVAVLDRDFFIRTISNGMELPRNGVQVRALKHRTTEERWTVVRADSPGAAMNHLNGYSPGNHATHGPCPACAAHVVLRGARRDTIDRYLR